MKKLLLLLLMFGIYQAGFSQYDPKALEILEEMSAKYNELSGFKAEFTYTLHNPQENINESFDGEVTVKGEKFRLKMGGQEIYNNGSTVWTYLPEVNEVNIDNYYPDAGDMTPSKIYSAYREGYKYLFLEEQQQEGNTFEIVDLVPEDPANQFFKIRLKIDKDLDALKGWEIFDKSGNRYNYNVTSFDPTASLGDNYFEFDPSQHKGVEVIDLR